MKRISKRRLSAALTAAAMCVSMSCAQFPVRLAESTIVHAATTISDMPSDYQYAADWIWENRVLQEDSMGINSKRWNSFFDQIIDGKGSINYVVRWHSTRTITLDQRQKLEVALDECINAWTDWLVGYENWPYDHVDVKIVGWAVTDPSLLLDLQDDEIVYTDTVTYEIQPGESSEIPTTMANAPSELSRFDHFYDESYEYPGGLDKRFDQYIWATQGFPDYGGCGGDWGQRLSDIYYIGVAEGTSSQHVQIHEVGHGFGFTDFYGGEGESDGFPPGGFPGDGSSIMMAGSSAEITDFDGWFMRYSWSKLSQDTTRFDLSDAQPETTEPTAAPTDAPVPTETITDTIPTETETGHIVLLDFMDTIVAKDETSVTFAEEGTFYIDPNYEISDPANDLANYEVGDVIGITCTCDLRDNTIHVFSITLIENSRGVKGDVNDDGSFTLLDIIMTQKWLLNAGEINKAEVGDVAPDGILDGFDLAAMKRMLLNQD